MIARTGIEDLPSGRVPFDGVADANVRSAIMRLNDNIMALKAQLENAQRAIAELQRRK